MKIPFFLKQTENQKKQKKGRTGWKSGRFAGWFFLSLPPISTIAVIMIFFMAFGFAMLYPKLALAKTTVKVQVEMDGNKIKYSNTGQTVKLNGNAISTKKIPSVKINSTWMVSVTEVFQDGLGCTYSYDDVSKRITLANPDIDNLTVSFTVGSTDVTITEGVGITGEEEGESSSETLPCQAVAATNVNTGKTGILVPVSFLAQKLGFYCTYKSASATITLTTAILLDRDVAVSKYDTSLYSNMLTTVFLEQNKAATRQELTVLTTDDIMEDQVKIEEDEVNGIYTYTFLNTYNALGNITKSFSGFFIKKISVTTSGQDVVVMVTYKQKYTATALMEEDGITTSFSSATYSLKVKLPESVTFSQVLDTDHYMNNQFILQIPGNWKSYYQSNPVIANNSVISKISVTTKSKQTYITVQTDKLQGYELIQNDGYFTVNIDDPKNIYSNIVVLDAGHGGKDNGATNRGTKEKDLNLLMIYTKAKEYFDSKNSNVKAYWTRTDDTFITLSDRARFASTVGADLFISLHMNSCGRSSVNGMEVYYSTNNNKTAVSGLTSRILARRMLNKLLGDLNASSRGVKTAGFYVIKHNTVPAILIELGFLSGNADYKKLTSASYQNQAAQSIYQCVESIFKKYPTKR